VLEFLYSIDVALFFFINHTLADPILDWVMPFVTNLNKQKPVIIIVFGILGMLVWKGGNKGKATAGLLVITILLSDQISSSIIKNLVGRIRPCGVLDGVRLLVDCGSGLSFPSSHAVNNFAGATIISHFYYSKKWYWFSIAALVALSRPYVGVHYPSDIIGGAIIGWGIATLVILIWEIFIKYLNHKSSDIKPVNPL